MPAVSMRKGRVKSRHFRDYFWSGDMLISSNEGVARKMEVRKFGGKDFLIFEVGGFDKDKMPTSWGKKYSVYIRAK